MCRLGVERAGTVIGIVLGSWEVKAKRGFPENPSEKAMNPNPLKCGYNSKP